MTDRFDEMSTSHAKLVSRLDRLESKQGDLASRVQRMGGGGDKPQPPDSSKPCAYCKKLGHDINSCEKFLAMKAKEAEREAADEKEK